MVNKSIDSKKLMYSKGSNDECYTPDYGVEPILEYIPKDAVVWCPFDDETSEFVKQISLSNKVIMSHIKEGEDFFTYEPEHWDVIVSNPPFTNKRKYFERALSFNKPFALIMTNTWLNDSAPKQLFKERDLQLLKFSDIFEDQFLRQSRDEDRSIKEGTLDLAWNLLSNIDTKFLVRLDQKWIDKYHPSEKKS